MLTEEQINALSIQIFGQMPGQWFESYRRFARAIEQAVRKEMEGELDTLKADRDELIFLRDDLLYWVDRAVDKGNANSDIEEASRRYDKWLQDRAAIDAARGQT